MINRKLLVVSSIVALGLMPMVGFASEITGTLSTDPHQTTINQGQQMDMPNMPGQAADASTVASNSVDKEFLVKFGIILIFIVIVIATAINTFSKKNGVEKVESKPAQPVQ